MKTANAAVNKIASKVFPHGFVNFRPSRLSVFLCAVFAFFAVKKLKNNHRAGFPTYSTSRELNETQEAAKPHTQLIADFNPRVGTAKPVP